MYWGVHMTALAVSRQLLGQANVGQANVSELNVAVKQTYQAAESNTLLLTG